MGDINIIDSTGDLLLALDSADGITIADVHEEIGKCTLALNGVTKSLNKMWILVPGTYVATQKKRAIFPEPSSQEENASIRRLEKVVYGLKNRDSKAVSYADYYTEKLNESRVHSWTPPFIEDPKMCLPSALRNLQKLELGPENEKIKPCWKRLIETPELFPGFSVGYEIGLLGTKIPDIALFPSNISKPSPGEFVAYGECKGHTWSGTSFSELGQGIQYGHRILDANPLRTHVYGFLTNNSIVVLIKSWRSRESPCLIHWDVSSVMTFYQGMATFTRLLRDNSGFVLPPTVQGSLVAIRKSLGTGRTSRAYLAEYAGVEVVAKLYDCSDKVNEDTRKIVEAHAAIDVSTDVDTAQIPTVQRAEGRWLLITPAGIPFTFNTVRADHIRKLVATLKLIHEFGIVHRDVRFANIFHLVRTDSVLLNDWGSSIRSQSMELVTGCPDRWAHPELCGVAEAVPRPKHDLYSMISSLGDLIAPGVARESQFMLLKDAFEAAESCEYNRVVESLVRHLQL